MYPGTRYMIGRAKLKTLKETTLNTFFELTRKLEFQDQYVYNSQSGIIKWSNGSEILLRDLFYFPSDPDFDSLGSLEITGAFIDECSQIVEKAWGIVRSRCRYKLTEYDVHGERTDTMEVLERNEDGVAILWRNSKGEETAGLSPKVLGTCNPSKNWVYRNFYKPARDGTISKTKKFIQALPTDNPHLPESYLDSLRNLDEASCQRLYFGNWEFDGDETTLFDYADVLSAFDNDFVEGGDKYITADVALHGSDLFVIGVWDGWRLIRIDSMTKSDGKQVLEKIKELAKEYRVSAKNIIYDNDGVGGFLRGFLRAARPFVNNSRVIGKKNYQNLKTQCYYELSDRFKKQTVYIADKTLSDRISEELGAVKRRDSDKDGKLKVTGKDEIRVQIGRSPDYADMIMMRLLPELKKPFKITVHN